MMRLDELWPSVVMGSTVALMVCVCAAVFWTDLAWFGVAASAAVFLITYFRCLGSVRMERPAAGIPEDAKGDAV